MTVGLWRVRAGDRVRWARGDVDTGPTELLAGVDSLAQLLAGPPGSVARAETGPSDGPVPSGAGLLAPLDTQEIWAAGVTYERSRDARKEESDTPDHYDRVYEAARPELFLKAAPGRSRGPGQLIGVRADSTWDVPEPELGVVVDCRGEVAGYVLGNDVSSRSIEGENPLYLPQAKIYTGSCAVGPCVVPVDAAPDVDGMTIRLAVRRDEAVVFDEKVHVSQMHRRVPELVMWLFAAQDFPDGVVLLTGTGLVPDPSFTLRSGDEVTISATGLGALTNPVQLVGAPMTT